MRYFEFIWLEDSPPLALESLFHDCLTIMEWNFGSSFKKKKKKRKDFWTI